MKDAILFDLDGTLLNTIDDIADSMNWALARLGWPTHTVDEYKRFVGDGVDKLVLRAAPEEAVQPGRLAAIKSLYNDRYSSHSADRTRPYDGALDAVRELRAMGLSLCVISNKPDDQTKDVIANWFGYDAFDLVAGGGAGFPLKPDPTLALHLLKNIGTTPERALFVGDMHVDIETGVNAGIDVIGASWGFRGRDELIAAGAKYVAASFPELVELVRGLVAG